jgi:hypothetical protein
VVLLQAGVIAAADDELKSASTMTDDLFSADLHLDPKLFEEMTERARRAGHGSCLFSRNP